MGIEEKTSSSFFDPKCMALCSRGQSQCAIAMVSVLVNGSPSPFVSIKPDKTAWSVMSKECGQSKWESLSLRRFTAQICSHRLVHDRRVEQLAIHDSVLAFSMSYDRQIL
jgi:hypothetical protein